MTFADEQIVYRDLAGAWGSYRLIVGGKDVTRFRGVPAQIGGYQLQEPYSFGPADFSFPQLTPFEVDAWGTGALHWFDMGKRVQLVKVNAAGARVRTIWRGFISSVNPTSDGTNVHCDGEASGTLANREKLPDLFVHDLDIGYRLASAFAQCNIPRAPILGIKTGFTTEARGVTGSYLAYCDAMLALAQKANGDQLTILWNGKRYAQVWKDRTTTDATVFLGAAGVSLDPTRDLQEEPTTVYGQGRSPDGLVWVNGKYPGLIQGSIPPFPGRLSLGDGGPGVETLQAKLIGTGYLTRENAIGGFDADTADAVRDLQEDAGLPQTGVVNQATWEAAYDLKDTGLSLRQAHSAPLAQLSAVRKYNYTSNGSRAGNNPNFRRNRPQVDTTVDFGSCEKGRATRWAKQYLAKVHDGKNWTGTLELTTDAAAGRHAHGTAPTQLSRLDLKAGMNILVRNFDGDTLFHVSGINVDADQTVRLAVDTKARDLLSLGEIIERNHASRSTPSRRWLRDRRPTSAHHRIVEFSEVGGRVFTTVDLEADKWTVFPVIAGQSGSVNQIRVKVTGSACEFVVAASAKRIGRGGWHQLAPNPFQGWNRPRLQQKADNERAILGIWGDDHQPGGYYPGVKTGDDGEPTGDALTGVLLEQGGFDYHTFDQPVIWMAVYPKQACKIEPQRVLWPVLEAGM